MSRVMMRTSLLVVMIAACSGDDGGGMPPGDDAADPPPPPCTSAEPCILARDVTQNLTIKTGEVYVIPSLKTLFVQAPSTLTIEPGAEIQGERGSILVIARGAKINAAGTRDQPILLTSAQATGKKTPGFWGGLLVLGAAPVNVNANSTPMSNEATFEAFTSAIPEGKFGGTDPRDNSGVIKYVRIEFAGFNFVADREFNNLTLCGVGDGTVVDFVQVHGGSDDGIELFGGTVNVKHIVSSQNQDDGFDTDNGWQGKAQFIIVQNISHPASLAEATNGYESDNHAAAASFAAVPRTLPTISNATLIGDHAYAGAKSFAAVFRRGTGGHYLNHIWLGFPLGPEIRDQQTLVQAEAGNLEIKNSMFFGNDGSPTNLPPAEVAPAVDINESLFFNAAHGIQFNVDPGLPAAAFDKAAPSFKPVAGAVALTGGVVPADPFFDQTATFIGAIGTDDWTAGWTAYPQN